MASRVEEATEPLDLSTNSLMSSDDNPEPKTLNDLVHNNPRMLVQQNGTMQARERKRGNLSSAASARPRSPARPPRGGARRAIAPAGVLSPPARARARRARAFSW